jgi:hypothetical protein
MKHDCGINGHKYEGRHDEEVCTVSFQGTITKRTHVRDVCKYCGHTIEVGDKP